MPGKRYTDPATWCQGWEGNMNVEYYKRIQLVEARHELLRSADVTATSAARRFQVLFLQEVRSPSSPIRRRAEAGGAGLYKSAGIAYLGNGRIARVIVLADEQELGAGGVDPINPKAFTRFPRALALGRRPRPSAEPARGMRRATSGPTQAEIVAGVEQNDVASCSRSRSTLRFLG